MSNIVCFYIEIPKFVAQAHLEKVLHDHNFPFYDATAFEPILQKNHTLEDIEIQYEGK